MQVRFLLTIVAISLLPFVFAGMSSFRPVRTYKCIRVIDGDTIILKKKTTTLRVRLANIDAPESSQKALSGEPIGKWSTFYLKELILNKSVEFESLSKDIYGRQIGLVYLNKININLKLVSSGYAIYYEKQTSGFYRGAQYRARINRRGFWKTQGLLNPSLYRRHKKTSH